MSSTRLTIDIKETAEKIIRGDFPDANQNIGDNILILNDEVMQIYMGLLTSALLSNMENDNDGIAKTRLKLFDDIMVVLNTNRCGRLYKLVEEINKATSKYEMIVEIWPSAKFRRNVLAFATDFWVWNDVERSMFLVFKQPLPNVEFLKESEAALSNEDMTDEADAIKNYDSGLEETE